MKYRGYEYEVVYCNPNQDWREHKGMFYSRSAVATSDFFSTYADAEEEAKRSIDKFVDAVPQTKREWLNAMESCMVWTGYEECHLDEDMVWELLNKAAICLKNKGVGL